MHPYSKRRDALQTPTPGSERLERLLRRAYERRPVERRPAHLVGHRRHPLGSTGATRAHWIRARPARLERSAARTIGAVDSRPRTTGKGHWLPRAMVTSGAPANRQAASADPALPFGSRLMPHHRARSEDRATILHTVTKSSACRASPGSSCGAHTGNQREPASAAITG